jgi:type IV secretory pathway VirB2 component (pilin)
MSKRTVIAVLLWLKTAGRVEAEAFEPPMPSQPDMHGAISVLHEWLELLYGPVANGVGVLAILIVLGSWVFAPKGQLLHPWIQKLISFLLIGTAPIMVPLLVGIAKR